MRLMKILENYKTFMNNHGTIPMVVTVKVILISTDSVHLLEEKLNDLIPANSVVVRYNMKETSLNDVLEEASYVSLFDDMKYLVVNNSDFFGKAKLTEKEEKSFLSYLDNPYPCTTIIFTTYDTIDKRKSITKKIIDNYKLIELKSPKNYDLIRETKSRTSKYNISDKSIKYIVDACLSNYDLVLEELDKLALMYKKDDTIKYEDIKNIVASNASDNVFKFVDAVIARDLRVSMTLYEEFLSLKLDPLQLINMLVREYRLLYYYKLYERKRYSMSDIMSNLRLADWQVQKLMKEASAYHTDDLKDYLINLSKLDYKIKSGKLDKTSAMYAFLLQNLEY